MSTAIAIADTKPSFRNAEKHTDWQAIDWRKANRLVRNLRQRIFRASQQGDLKKVRSLQKLMLRSYSNTLVSVRRVTQTNHGKNTPGVDKLVVKTSSARGKLVDELMTYQPWRAKPVRRVYIPKGAKSNGKLRPLGIPTIIDRCLQAKVKNALEPYWEARFEGTSYGFRPGRGCHDAIAKIYLLTRPNKQKKWVVDADIKGAFDNIDHDYLLNTIGGFPARELVKQWLKTGYMEGGVFHATEAGTPQGGIISPLLANIALHGMEEALDVKYNNRGEIRGPRAVVRYADDFVVFCESRQDAERVVTVLTEWLAQRGLTLSEEKTRIVHLTEGFDFLGFTIKHYPAPQTSKSGYKLLIRPSKESVSRIRDKLRQEWLLMKGYGVADILITLNPIIRGWANYFRIGVASKTFRQLDYWMFHREVRYANRKHPTKGKWWRVRKYWGQLNPKRNDNWVFGDKQTGRYLLKFIWFPIERNVLVKGQCSPDDPALREYWAMREAHKIKDLSARQRWLAHVQNYKCPLCGALLLNGEELQVHHKRPRGKGGGDDWQNRALVHLYCQQQIHGGKQALQAHDAQGRPLLLA